VLPVKNASNSTQHGLGADPSKQRLLILADQTAAFHKLVKNQSSDNKSLEFSLEIEEGLPQYIKAKIAKFSPKTGKTAAIVSSVGLHIVDMVTKKESLLLIQLDILALEYSPCERFVVCCEKWNM
jgi:hypothetical protein